jgi:thiol-disulfide isomerase/thioredoxin
MNQCITILISTLFFLVTQAVTASETNGHVAPACEASSISDAKNYNLQQFKGKVVYVDFWASWCGPCLQSFPFMNSLEMELKDKDFKVLAINMDESLADAQNFLKEHPTKFTVLNGTDQKCAKAFEVKAMPSSYLIDRNGVIRHEHLGFRAGETGQLQTFIKQLLSEPPASH